MASGDTIAGQVRVILEDAQGNRNVVFGSVPQSRVDYVNDSPQPDEKLYVNTGLSSLTTAPAGAQTRRAPDAVFESGEKLIVQHKSNNDNARAHDLDADAYEIEGAELDLNRDNSFSETLTVADQELSGTASESASQFVDIFSFTVPDRTRFYMSGLFGATGVEN